MLTQVFSLIWLSDISNLARQSLCPGQWRVSSQLMQSQWIFFFFVLVIIFIPRVNGTLQAEVGKVTLKREANEVLSFDFFTQN